MFLVFRETRTERFDTNDLFLTDAHKQLVRDCKAIGKNVVVVLISGRVLAIAPGLFETAMTSGLTDEIRAAITANIPFPHRLGLPREYALLVRHMVENPALNGEVVRLDNALRLPPK